MCNGIEQRPSTGLAPGSEDEDVPAVDLPFSHGGYAGRLRGTRQAMDRIGVEVLTVLRPDMTFHSMPGLWMEDRGLEITETLLVGEAGPAECLADRPRGLSVKG